MRHVPIAARSVPPGIDGESTRHRSRVDDIVIVPVPTPPDTRRALPGRRAIRPRSRWPALAAAAGFAAGLGAPAGADARIYGPAAVPRAHYVAPLAPWPQPSYRAKDFSILEKNGWYHLVYTRVQRFVPHHWSDGTRTILNETTFGHAISRDLETWQELDSVLTVSPNGASWDAHHLWAPSLVEHGGTTWMFFAGVRDRQESTSPSDWVPRWQSIGAAYSTDPELRQWVRLPAPVWAACPDFNLPGVSWALCNATVPHGTAGFRDPYVEAPAPGSGDPWLLYFTARPRTDQYNYVVGVAQAPSPAGPWSDAGALWSTYLPPLNSKVESPHVFRRGDQWNLFFTGDDGSTGIARQTAAGSPFGPWTAQASLNLALKDMKDHPYEFSLEPEAWFASERFARVTPTRTLDYLAVVHSYDATAEYNPPAPGVPDDISVVEFRRIDWDDATGAFRLVAPNPVRSLTASRGALELGEQLTITLGIEGGEDQVGEFEVHIEQGGESFEIDATDVGLPASIALDTPTTVVPWTVEAASVAPPYTMVVSLVSQPLELAARIDVTGPLPGGEEVGPSTPPVTRATPAQRAGLRPMAAAGGAPPALQLDLPGPGPVRIALYDALGRHVRTLVDEPLAAGRTTWTWDGRDAAGRPAPRGVYFARLTGPFGVHTARIVSLQ
jgi:hypothetical protein